jgi:hypothetical protein
MLVLSAPGVKRNPDKDLLTSPAARAEYRSPTGGFQRVRV